MKKICVLIIIIFSSSSYSQDCNIGNETPTELINNFSANFLLGVKFTLSQEGTLNSFNLIGNNTGGGVQMAVYDDNSGVPNNLIISSSLGTIDNEIISLPVTPTLLQAGDYWVMAVYEIDGNSSTFNENSSEFVSYFQSLTYGAALPTNASDFFVISGLEILYYLEISCGNNLSIENFDLDDEFSIYPNPSFNYIQVSNLTKIEDYNIYNISGEIVLNGSISNTSKIDVRSLSTGLYFLKFDNGQKLKFVVK